MPNLLTEFVPRVGDRIRFTRTTAPDVIWEITNVEPEMFTVLSRDGQPVNVWNMDVFMLRPVHVFGEE